MQAEIGDIVLWYPDGDLHQTPLCGLVTAIGYGGLTLNLNIFDATMKNMRVKDGVRHVSDERARDEALRESGTWDHTPRTKRVLALLRELGAGQDKKPAPDKKQEVKP